MASQVVGTYPDNQAFVYVIAGADGSFANTAGVSRYDVGLEEWSSLAPLPQARTQIGAARIGNRIYVPGGYAGSFSPVTTLSIYDIANNVWTTGATLPQATGDYGIGVYADRYLYVIGGYSGAGDLNNVQVYDSVLDTWTNATPKMGTATAGLRAAIVGNRILVVGGYSQTLAAPLASAVVGTIDPNNPALIAWAAAPDYPGGPAGRLGGGTLEAAGPGRGSAAMNIAIFTGGDPTGQGVQVKNDTWVYDFDDGTWEDAPNKPTGVSNIGNLAGVAHGGKLHLVSTGGYTGTAVTNVAEWLTLGDEPSPDLAITVSDEGSAIIPGGSVAYTLDYASTGTGNTPNVVVTETVPAGTTFDAAASTPGWTCAPDANPGSTCEFDLGTLPGGASGSLVFAVDSIYPVPAGVTQIANTASIATDWADPAPANDTATETTAFAAGDVSITPVDTLSSEFGDTASFQIVLLVPPTVDVTIDMASSDTTEGMPAVSQVTFTPANWNQAQNVSVVGVDDALADGDVAYSITSTIASGAGNYEGVAIADVALTNLDELDLSLMLDDGNATADPGGFVVYTLAYAVSGAGAAAATNVTVTDTVPAGTIFNGAASTVGWTCAPDANAGSVCTFDLGTMPAGANGTLVFALDSVYPVPSGVTQIANTASIATDWADAEPGNDGDTETTPFTAGNVSVTPIHSQSGESGEIATFQLALQVRPSADVTIAVASNDATEGATTVSQIVFAQADWDVPQTVTVTGVDDALEDGDIAYAVTSTVLPGPGNYDGVAIADFAVTNRDDETAGGPSITGIGSVRDTGDDALDGEEVTGVAITQLVVRFSEPMSATSADIAHFRLVAAGGDGVAQTAGCAGTTVGDDLGVALADVVLAPPPANSAAVLIAGGHALPLGAYRFFVCDTLTDVSGNPLAAELARDFRITATNMLVNPNFDRALAGWTASSPAETAWNGDDADTAPTSGSARVDTADGAAPAYALEQCIAGPTFVAAAASVRIGSGTAAAPSARVQVDYFAEAGCTGATVDSIASTPVQGDTAGDWVALEVAVPHPAPLAFSARVRLEVTGHTAPASFTVDFDHAEARQLPAIFADGFESP